MTRFLQDGRSYYSPFLLEEDTTVFLQSLVRKKFASIHPIVKVNAVALIVYRLRNNKEVESFLEEFSDLTGKNELLAIYKAATVLYVALAARKVSEMFYKNFSGRIELEDENNDWYFYLSIIISTIKALWKRKSLNQ